MLVPLKWAGQDKRFADGLKENLDIICGHRGDPLDRAITARDLLESGMAKLPAGSTVFGGSSRELIPPTTIPDLTIPPKPTNLQADGAFQNILLSWDLPLYIGHAHVEIWRNTSNSTTGWALLATTTQAFGSYADNVGSGATFYYWVRAVNKNDRAGPYNSSAGTQGQTAPDIAFLINTLSNSITSSELAASLNTQLSTYQTLTDVNGNITARGYQTLSQVNNAADLQIQSAGTNYGYQVANQVAATVGTAVAGVRGKIPAWTANGAYAVNEVVRDSAGKLYVCLVAVTASTADTLPTTFAAPTTNWALYGDIARIEDSASAITQINLLASTSTSAAAQAIHGINSVLFDTNGDAVVSATNLSTMKTSLLNENGVARATASQIDYLSSSYTNPDTGVANNVTLQQAMNTSASSVNGLNAQYSVKIDNNGHVSGFGLSSTLSNGTPSSAFIVRSDKFAVVNPTDTSAMTNSPSPAHVPFIVTAATNIDGVAVPAGAYMKSAFIHDGSITNARIRDAAIDNAKIANLSAEKITSGLINTSRLNIDSASLTSVNGVLQIGNVNVNKLTGTSISATIMSGTTVYANRLTGDVNKLLPFRSTTSVSFKGNAASGGGTVQIIAVQLPATTHLTVGHKPFGSITGWYDSAASKTYSFKLYMQLGSGAYQLVGETRFKATTNLYSQFAVSGSLATATTSTVNMKLEVTRTGSSGIYDIDTSGTIDRVHEVSGFILGAR
jgi:hypothetical protein